MCALLGIPETKVRTGEQSPPRPPLAVVEPDPREEPARSSSTLSLTAQQSLSSIKVRRYDGWHLGFCLHGAVEDLPGLSRGAGAELSEYLVEDLVLEGARLGRSGRRATVTRLKTPVDQLSCDTGVAQSATRCALGEPYTVAVPDQRAAGAQDGIIGSRGRLITRRRRKVEPPPQRVNQESGDVGGGQVGKHLRRRWSP